MTIVSQPVSSYALRLASDEGLRSRRSITRISLRGLYAQPRLLERIVPVDADQPQLLATLFRSSCESAFL
jgi:hypothetical protein